MRIIVILLAVSLLGALASCKDKKQKEVLTSKTVETIKQEPVAPPKETPKPVVKQVNYYLVAGCFKVPSNAERLHDKLLSEGYDSKILPFYDMSMVTYNGYETHEEAQVALNRIVQEEGKELTWIYPVK